MKNPNSQRGDSNLRRRFQSEALIAIHYTIRFPKKESIKSRDKQLSSLPFVHGFPHIMTDANFMIQKSFFGEADGVVDSKANNE